MRIRTLGRSGLRVSELCLGTMTFGMPGHRIVNVLRPAAAEAGCPHAQLAIAGQLVKPEATSAIRGARSQAQLDDTLAAAGTSVPEEVLARLDGASAIPPEHPNVFIDTIQRWLGNR